MSDFRLRSDDELKRQNVGLTEVAEVLESLEVPYFLVEGTLLGAVRDGTFIRWDWDVGIALMYETAMQKLLRISAVLREKGFEVEVIFGSSAKVNARKYGTKYELTIWRRRGKMRVRRGRRIPDHFFAACGEIQFMGRTYPCPSPAEGYLKFCYGNWRVPIMSEDTDTWRSQSIARLILAGLRNTFKLS